MSTLGEPERTVLLATARSDFAPSDVESVRAILTAAGHRFDWAQLIGAASAHRVLPMVAANVTLVTGKAQGVLLVPPGPSAMIRLAYTGNAARNFRIQRELARILTACADRDIPVIVRKGAYLSRVIYRDPAMRYMRDLDLLIDTPDVAAFGAALESIGYESGHVSWDERSVEPWTRAEVAFHRLSLPNVPGFAKLIADPALPTLGVDPVTALYEPTAGDPMAFADLLQRSIEADFSGTLGHVLDDADCLIDIATHLYKDAKSLVGVARGKDLILAKFWDVAAFVAARRDLDWAVFQDRVESHRLNQPVHFALALTERVYPGSIPRGPLTTLERPGFKEGLDCYGELEGAANRWTGDFMDRLFDDRRRWGLTSMSTVDQLP